MDRFKRRYKKDNSVESKSKKSEKISEMAKQLESVIGKPNVSADIKYENDISNDIEQVQENNMEEILENVPVVNKKTKKPQKLQF